VFLQYFGTVGLGLLTCKNRRRVGGDLNRAQSINVFKNVKLEPGANTIAIHCQYSLSNQNQCDFSPALLFTVMFTCVEWQKKNQTYLRLISNV